MAATAAALSGCDENSETQKPVIANLALGIGNNHTAYIGSDMHMEAEIAAEGIIDRITVEIHSEDGSGDEIEAEYADYAGQRNAAFHKHIDIPDATAPGEYHFHLTVTDREGNSTTVEEDIAIEDSADAELPVLSVESAPAENEAFTAGQNIRISGRVTDNTAVGGMMAVLVRDGETPTEQNLIIMFLRYYQDAAEVEFEATIDAGAEYDKNITPARIQGSNAWQSGKYSILVRAWDPSSNTVDRYYPISINL
jgi:hypothetical protein